MKKKCAIISFVIALVLSVSVSALSPYALTRNINLSFDGTTAECSATIIADNDDKISGTLALWDGNKLVDDWTDDATYLLRFDETVSVTKGKTYKLTFNYTINGVPQQELSKSATCR